MHKLMYSEVDNTSQAVFRVLVHVGGGIQLMKSICVSTKCDQYIFYASLRADFEYEVQIRF